MNDNENTSQGVDTMKRYCQIHTLSFPSPDTKKVEYYSDRGYHTCRYFGRFCDPKEIDDSVQAWINDGEITGGKRG